MAYTRLIFNISMLVVFVIIFRNPFKIFYIEKRHPASSLRYSRCCQSYGTLFRLSINVLVYTHVSVCWVYEDALATWCNIMRIFYKELYE
jgi:hypothetical protein